MSVDLTTIIISISAAVLSGFGARLMSSFSEKKREVVRRQERYQDQLKLDLKDLKIQLYQVEKDLNEWKDKYYDAIKQLIEVRVELEETLIKLSIIHIKHEHDYQEESQKFLKMVNTVLPLQILFVWDKSCNTCGPLQNIHQLKLILV